MYLRLLFKDESETLRDFNTTATILYAFFSNKHVKLERDDLVMFLQQSKLNLGGSFRCDCHSNRRLTH